MTSVDPFLFPSCFVALKIHKRQQHTFQIGKNVPIRLSKNNILCFVRVRMMSKYSCKLTNIYNVLLHF